MFFNKTSRLMCFWGGRLLKVMFAFHFRVLKKKKLLRGPLADSVYNYVHWSVAKYVHLPTVNVLCFRIESCKELNIGDFESLGFDFVGKPGGTETVHGALSRFVDFDAGRVRQRDTNRIRTTRPDHSARALRHIFRLRFRGRLRWRRRKSRAVQCHYGQWKYVRVSPLPITRGRP